MGLYATDGKCHNAEPGTYGHECGKPANWLGRTAKGFVAGYCDRCKAGGYEAKDVVSWVRYHGLDVNERTLNEQIAAGNAWAGDGRN